MDNLSLIKRKTSLQEIALNQYSNGAYIYNLIKNGYLDHIIEKIDDKRTYTNCNSIIKKGFLTGEEQFIDIILEFYHYFESRFLPLKHKEWHFSRILENKIPEFLLCKNYWGNNDFIPYYHYNIQKIVAENVYDNIKFIYDEFPYFFKELKITKRLSMKNKKNIESIFNFAIELIWCNCKQNQYFLNYVFANYKYSILDFEKKHKNKSLDAESIMKKDYVIHWEELIVKYQKNINLIREIS